MSREPRESGVATIAEVNCSHIVRLQGHIGQNVVLHNLPEQRDIMNNVAIGSSS